MMKNLGAIIFTFLLYTLSTLYSYAFDAEILEKDSRDSIVKIEVNGLDKFEKRKTEKGSGFVVYSNEKFSLIATAAHVVGAKTDWSIDEAGDPKFKITVSRRSQDGALEVLSEQASIFGDHSEKPPEADWELIVIDRGNLPELRIGSELPIPLGTEVLLLGFPLDDTDIDALIGKAQSFNVLKYGVRQPLIFDGGHPDRGHSGSAILNSNGEVIGLASENFRESNRDIHLAVFASFFAKIINDIPGSDQVPEFEIRKCVASKIDGQITRPFSQKGSVRCPGGGCLFQSGSCNRRETRLSYAAPSGYFIDDYKFIQNSNNAGVTGNLRTDRDARNQVIEVSITLICDPSDLPGAGGGWNNGIIEGVLRFANIEILKERAEEECKIELTR